MKTSLSLIGTSLAVLLVYVIHNYIQTFEETSTCKGSPTFDHNTSINYTFTIKLKENWHNCKGVVIYKEGVVYVGNFRNGFPYDTKGNFYYANGDHYIGSIAKARRHGIGVHYFDDGRVWDGTWWNNEWCNTIECEETNTKYEIGEYD